MVVRPSASFPVAAAAAAAAVVLPTALSPGQGPTLEPELHSWSSLIGIITAIAGNVLISIALNIQRYAHIRLGRANAQRDKTATAARNGQRNAEDEDGPRLSGSVAESQNGDMENGAVAAQSAESGFDHYADDEATGSHGRAYKTMPSGPKNSPNALRRSESVPLLGNPLLQTRRETYLSSPIWWTGFFLIMLGETGNFIAYGFAPASVVSPLGVVALISNCVIAPIMLREPFRRRDFGGILIAVAGAVTIVLSAAPSEEKLDPDMIWHAITRLEFEIYLIVTLLMILVLVIASERYGARFIFIDLGLVGLFGGYTALSTKGVSSLLSHTLWRLLTFPITYLLLAVLVLSALLQIRYINRALQRFNATQVIPTQFVCFTISVIVGSAILYRDFERATPARVGKFVLGCAMTFLGVYLITTGQRPAQYRKSSAAPSTGL